MARVAIALLGAERARDLDLVAAVLPQRDPAGHRAHVLVAEVLLQRARGVRGAIARGAVQDQLGGAVGRDALDARLQVPAGHALGPGNVAGGELFAAAHVDDGHALAHRARSPRTGRPLSIWLLTRRRSSAPDVLILKLLNHGRDSGTSKSIASFGPRVKGLSARGAPPVCRVYDDPLDFVPGARPAIPSRCDVHTRMLGPAPPRPRRCPGADGGRGACCGPRGLRWKRRELLLLRLILRAADLLGEQRHRIRRRGAPGSAPRRELHAARPARATGVAARLPRPGGRARLPVLHVRLALRADRPADPRRAGRTPPRPCRC